MGNRLGEFRRIAKSTVGIYTKHATSLTRHLPTVVSLSLVCPNPLPPLPPQQQLLRLGIFFFFFSFPLTVPLLSTGALGHPLLLANASGGPIFLKYAPAALLATPGSSYSFFSFSVDPSLSLTGALLGPHSLANTSGGPLFLKYAPAAPLATPGSSYSFFSFSVDPLPFSHRCATRLKTRVGVPFLPPATPYCSRTQHATLQPAGLFFF